MHLELATFLWMCIKDGQTFQALSWSGDWGAPYGTCLMYAQNGDTFHWNTFSDNTYDSCRNLVSSLLKESSNHKKSVATKSVSGIVCDSGSDGSILRDEPYCPFCEESEVQIIKILEVKQYMIPEVTHIVWNSLNEQEQEQRVLSELIRQKFIKPEKD